MTAVAGPRSRTATLALAAAVASGAVVALQQRVNGELKVELGDALLTALVSFGTGLVAVIAVVLARASSRAAVARVRQVPWMQRLGGLGGASLVAVGAAAAPEIGVALLTVGLVAGQTSGGLVVDRMGLGPGGAHGLTAPRIAGAALCLVAVGISVLGDGAREAAPLLLVLVVAAGFAISIQQALNGRVRRTTGDAGVATLVNFVVGTIALGLGVLLHAAVAGLEVGDWPGWSEWYLYSGGPMGASFVAVAAVVVRRLGVLRLGLAVIAGQLVGALLLDVLLPVQDQTVELLTVVGVGLTLVAVAVSGRAART
ncbi:MAG: family transporter [Frankiales bacterium]|nr:family transporter [Frankiales bacterium]